MFKFKTFQHFMTSLFLNTNKSTYIIMYVYMYIGSYNKLSKTFNCLTTYIHVDNKDKYIFKTYQFRKQVDSSLSKHQVYIS